MVSIVTQNTPEDFMAFRNFNLVKSNPVFFFVAPAVMLILGIVILFLTPVLGIVFLAIGILYPPLLILSSKQSSKKFIKHSHNYFATATRADFSSENIRLVAAAPNTTPVEAVANYKEIYKVFETSVYFFLYLTKARCVILPKRDVVQGTVAELSALLQGILCPLNKYAFRK